ncbi:MAG: MGMT family protein [Candidatus Lokiarchaeota archaeon]|nr:MGMT family protein [Candidatus Lokiarchaeota archaeon]
MPSDFTEKIIQIIKNIPKGKVLTYGFIAKLAGNPRAARQVSWTLHSSSKKYNLPWHRVINSKGIIALKSIEDREYQKKLLEQEGIEFTDEFRADLKKYLWKIDNIEKVEE